MCNTTKTIEKLARGQLKPRLRPTHFRERRPSYRVVHSGLDWVDHGVNFIGDVLVNCIYLLGLHKIVKLQLLVDECNR